VPHFYLIAFGGQSQAVECPAEIDPEAEVGRVLAGMSADELSALAGCGAWRAARLLAAAVCYRVGGRMLAHDPAYDAYRDLYERWEKKKSGARPGLVPASTDMPLRRAI